MDGCGRALTGGRTVVWSCFDPRQRVLVEEALRRSRYLLGDLHPLGAVGGGTYALLRAHPMVRKEHLENLQLCVQNHEVRRIIVVNHTGCRKYHGPHCPNDRTFHEAEVRLAIRELRDWFLDVELVGFVCEQATENTFSPNLLVAWPLMDLASAARSRLSAL